MPKTRQSTRRRTAINPHSSTRARLSRRTEENLRSDAKLFRDKFIAEYLIDFNAAAAYLRAGGTAKAKSAQHYNTAYYLTQEPYVAKKIQEAVDAAEASGLVNRNRVIAGLVREANYHSLGASHGARVSSWGKLATILGMDTKRIEMNLSARVGILVVPMTDALESWEARSIAAQAALKLAVRS